jgi:hypothetical protein
MGLKSRGGKRNTHKQISGKYIGDLLMIEWKGTYEEGFLILISDSHILLLVSCAPDSFPNTLSFLP